MLSFWEKNHVQQSQDLVIVGAGIVGCNAAITYLELRPGSRVLVLDEGVLPNGASSKNAGFACIGSVSELLDDMAQMTDEEVLALVKSRWHGLTMLKNRVPLEAMCYEEHGGHEVFPDLDSYTRCLAMMDRVNKLLVPCFGQHVFEVSTGLKEEFGFETPGELITNPFEGQLDPMAMMIALRKKAKLLGAEFYTGAAVTEVHDAEVRLKNGLVFNAKRVLVATNGFASRLLHVQVKPARAQVLITSPIEGLRLKGVFHMNKGYYYFRNVGDRVLFGGGRHLDFGAEETMDLCTTELIQNELERLLREVVIPGKEFRVEHRWAGIMGVGEKRSPIVERLGEGLFCAVRMGGMGVALGSLVGDEVARLIDSSL